MSVIENMVKLTWNKPEKKSICNKYNIYIGNKRYASRIRNNSYLIREKNLFCKDLGVQIVGDINLDGETFYGNGN